MVLKCVGFSALVLFLSGCNTQTYQVGQFQDPRQAREILAKLEPTVREIPEADVTLLWKATEGYMKRAWRQDQLAIHDPARRVMETHTVEWEEGRFSHRTRVTVEVKPDAKDPKLARLGVVALLIEPQVDYAEAQDGRPLTAQWALLGNNPEIERIVADQIVGRYLVLRQGRDPETAPLGELPATYRLDD